MVQAVGRCARAQNTRGGKNKSAEIARCFQELVRETIRENELRKQEDALNAVRARVSHGAQLVVRLEIDPADESALAFLPPAETFASEIESAVARFAETLATTRRLPSDAALMAKMAAAAEADASEMGEVDTAVELQTDEKHLALTRDVKRSLRFGFETATAYRELYDVFRAMAAANAAVDLEGMVAEYRAGKLTLDVFRRKTITFLDQKRRIEQMKIDADVGIVRIDSEAAQRRLLPAAWPPSWSRCPRRCSSSPRTCTRSSSRRCTRARSGSARAWTSLRELCDCMRFVSELRQGHRSRSTAARRSARSRRRWRRPRGSRRITSRGSTRSWTGRLWR